jgi:hypothetical protein
MDKAGSMTILPADKGEVSRRGVLAAAALCAGGLWAPRLIGCASAQPAEGAVALPDLRLPGDRDDSAAFARALQTGRPVFLPAGRGSGQGGVYVVGQIELAGGSRISGEGDRTLIRPRDPGVRHLFHAESDAPGSFVRGIELRNFRIEGRLPGSGFREHWNSIDLAGVEDVTIDGIHFHGFTGDAIMFAGESGRNRGSGALSPRHNRRLIVRNCRFDGIDRDTRNGISIVDGTDVQIENCRFENIARPDMPGAIDIEPNPYPFYRVGNVAIRGCTFVRCGGSNGAISLYVPAVVAAVPGGFEFIGNRFDSNLAADIWINFNRRWQASDPDCAIRIDSNRGNGGRSPWNILSAKGVAIGRGNVWTDYAASAMLGYSEPLTHVRGFVDEATYQRVGRGGPPSPFGIAVFNATDARFSGAYVDCGDGSADAAAIAFINDGARDIEISNARFSAPGRQTRHAVRAFRGFGRGEARQSGNDFGGLATDLADAR